MKFQYFLLAVLPMTLAKYSCECPLVNCKGDEAAICRCVNDAAIRCYKRCGIPPQLQICPTPSIEIPSTIPTLELRSLPTRTACGSRGLPNCPVGTTCINDPERPGCDIAVDCAGLCVKLNGPFCGGIADIPCPRRGQFCVDDPRDDCAPPSGADCGGICVFLDGRPSA